MPRWLPHSKGLAALSRRYRLNVQPGEFLSGLLPTVQIDKHWETDTLDVYGMSVQHVKIAGSTSIMSVGLLSGTRDVLVHRVEWWIGVGGPGTSGFVADRQGFVAHLFTPNSAYNPFAISPGVFFPWMQTRQKPGSIVSLPGAFGIGGEALTHQTIIVNGVPIVTFGPSIRSARETVFSNLARGLVPQLDSGFWRFQDPPLRIKPGQNLVVQMVDVLTSALWEGISLNANFWWSERDPQGDTG